MACGHKGEDVCANLSTCKPLACFWIAGANKEQQDVIGYGRGVLFSCLFARFNHVINGIVQETNSRAGTEAANARNKIGKVKNIEGVYLAKRIKISTHGRT